MSEDKREGEVRWRQAGSEEEQGRGTWMAGARPGRKAAAASGRRGTLSVLEAEQERIHEVLGRFGGTKNTGGLKFFRKV